MTTLNIRIEENLKAKANKTFSKLGLDMSSAVKLFLAQSVKENGLPFTPTNDVSIIKAKWDKEVVGALKNGKRYSSGKDLLNDILE